MDLLRGPVRRTYFKYLAACFGGTLISSIYGIVDMAMVGQYQGPEGTAALAVVAPVWNMLYGFGFLTGIGGSVLLGAARGRGEAEEGNRCFTAAFIGTIFLTALLWTLVAFFDAPLLRLFGADDVLLPLARSYLYPVKFVVPVFLFGQLISAFLRNDGSPALVTAAVLTGGIFNVFGDYYFVFVLDLGVMGAGLATSMGAVLSFSVMLIHFFTRRNTLRLVRPDRLLYRLRRIGVTGFSTFFSDVAMGILTMLFNRQIMRYLGSDALSVYGVIVNVSTIVQCCAYSVGQAAQPMLSVNFGARQAARIREILRCALYATAFFAAAWTAAVIAVPQGFIRVFMAATPEILDIAPAIMRAYAVSFVLLPFNVFSTYYFQSIMRPAASFAVSVARGLVISGALIFALPAALGAGAIWYAMPLTELFVALAAAIMIKRYTAALPK